MEYRQWVEEHWSRAVVERPSPVVLNAVPVVKPVLTKPAPTYASVAKHNFISLGKMSSDYLKNSSKNASLKGAKTDSESEISKKSNKFKTSSNSSIDSVASQLNDCQRRQLLASSGQVSSSTCNSATQKSIQCRSEPNLHSTRCCSNLRTETVHSTKSLPLESKTSNSLPSPRASGCSFPNSSVQNWAGKEVSYSGVTKSNLKLSQVSNSRTASSSCTAVTDQSGSVSAITKCKMSPTGDVNSNTPTGPMAALPHSPPSTSVSAIAKYRFVC